jgi:hypothetical protein
LLEGLAQGNPHILDEVVGVISLSGDLQAEPSVVLEALEHVIEEGKTAADAVWSWIVEIEEKADLGFPSLALNRRASHGSDLYSLKGGF